MTLNLWGKGLSFLFSARWLFGTDMLDYNRGSVRLLGDYYDHCWLISKT